MNRACAGQTVLDLFPAPPRDHVEDTIRWMCDVHGCIRGEIEVEVRELDGMRRPTGEDAIRAAALLLSIPLLLACLPLIAYDWIKERKK